jgi:hypothetical protein
MPMKVYKYMCVTHDGSRQVVNNGALWQNIVLYKCCYLQELYRCSCKRDKRTRELMERKKGMD